MYRFALRPAWLLSHAFAVTLIVLFANLGLWQLDRHDQKVDQNETVANRTVEPAITVRQLLDDLDGQSVEDLRYRPVTARGTYEDGADVLIDNRSYDGLPGAWVVTPLRLDDGSLVAVSRGFQGFDSGEIDPPPPPTGVVEVTGTALPWDERSCGIRTDDSGEPVGAACVREEAVEQAVGEPLLPVAIQRSSSAPVDAEVFVAVPLPELDDGPHRSYAVQWFIFATIGLIGYPLILRRVARDKARERAADPDPSRVAGSRS
ncbi:MAG: SURF1 family protein [Acidimicrobiales bacterium]